ncbi:hypothetical protein [Streptosporangium carneum]|uniref:Uncharacterized protein n=1 Tax=Streptosporangium carneum TaxID=47481 RepID=A0A9W6I4X4_9ACTN|nr:hypothetical protein [Streptosporangium carneum]GLK11243.1 hypothetical protein GCM10017600_46490 [Streptosporangium carneum]
MPLRVLLLGVAASLAAAPALVLGAQSAASAGTVRSDAEGCALVNGGFEEPGGLRGQGHLRRDVPGWSTSSSDGVIELWGPGNRADPMNFTVPADSGRQFAEVNGTAVSTLYQDVETEPGSTLTWSLAHRGRTRGPGSEDVLRVRIGGVVQTPEGQDSPDISDSSAAWGHYKGSYRVPSGQKVTRVEFVSVSSGTGLPTYGNFLDSVEISCEAPCVRNLPPTSPYLLLSGLVGRRLNGFLASTDPEGGEITYSLNSPEGPQPQVAVRPDGYVTFRSSSPGIYEVPVRACDKDGECSDGRVVVVVYGFRSGPLTGPMVKLSTIKRTASPLHSE